MRIAVIGGMDRNAPHLEQLARSRGHELEHHTGRTGGGTHAIRRMIERADVVLVLLDVNSHNGAHAAKSAARDLGRRIVVLRQCGVARVREIIDGLGPSPKRAA
jgi:hypothetical protein